MTRQHPICLALLALLAIPGVLGHPVGPSSNSGTLVADFFSGCVPGSNCDVLFLTVDAGPSHTIVHSVSASHSSGFPPAYNLYLRMATGGAIVPIPGCPDAFTPASPALAQTCTLPASSAQVRVVGYFEALRPHQVGVVTFSHALAAF